MFSELSRIVRAGFIGCMFMAVMAGCKTPPAVYPDSPPAVAQAEVQDGEAIEEMADPSKGPPPADAADNLGPNLLAWDAVFKEFRARNDETNAPFTFNVTNISSEPLLIFGTEAPCDCTVAQLPSNPWSLAPAASGQLHANVDLTKKTGVGTNYIIVFTSKGNRMLSLKTVVPRRAPASVQRVQP